MPIDSYEDDDEEQEGPKSSFGTYLAEGDALFKQSEYKKALESYSLALELQCDKICLVARSKCYLKLGDPQKALQDAEDALNEDKEYNKGLYRKAEALYCMGDFEYALMYYHRGHKLRPELDEFRLGIQKAQEAIDNSIGSAAKIKLENKGDLSFFTKQDDAVNKKRAGYLKPINTKKLKPLANRNKEVKPPAPSKKTVKQLLGELYSDKEYFEKLMEDEAFIKSPHNSQIYELVQGGLNYLETRTEFWRQQKPLYARKKEKAKYNTVRKKTKPSISKYVLKQLQEVDQALSSGNATRSLRLAQQLLKSVEGINKDDLPNKMEVIANIHSCIGNAYIDTEQLGKALRHHEKDLQTSKQCKSTDGISRALDNTGRVHARLGNFKKAVTCWNEKLPLVKASLESTWLCHEIGRCYLELANYDKALEFGQKSLASGKDCEDQIWQLNATVLIAQSQVKLGNVDDAIETFSNGLELAVSLEDVSAQAAISKALADLQRRSSQASRNTARSEEETSPRLKSNMSDRDAAISPTGSRKAGSRGSSRGNSPIVRIDEKVGSSGDKINLDDDVQEDNNTENTENEFVTHVTISRNSGINESHDNKDENSNSNTNGNQDDEENAKCEADRSGAEQDPRGNETLQLSESVRFSDDGAKESAPQEREEEMEYGENNTETENLGENTDTEEQGATSKLDDEVSGFFDDPTNTKVSETEPQPLDESHENKDDNVEAVEPNGGTVPSETTATEENSDGKLPEKEGVETIVNDKEDGGAENTEAPLDQNSDAAENTVEDAEHDNVENNTSETEPSSVDDTLDISAATDTQSDNAMVSSTEEIENSGTEDITAALSSTSLSTADELPKDTNEMANDSSETGKDASETEKDSSETDKDSSETEKDSIETDKDSSETDKDTSGTEKDASETEKDASETEKDASETEKDASETEKDASETEKDASETEKDASETEKDASETEKDASETEKDISETEKDTSETEKDASETEKDTSEAEKDVSELAKEASETEKDTSELAKDTSETEKDTSELAKDASETEKDTSELAKDASET